MVLAAVEVVGGFDYRRLKDEQREFVQEQFGEIKTLVRRHAYETVQIGQRLIAVRECLGYGLYVDWLESEFPWGKSAAYRYEQVALAFGKYAELFPIWEKFDLSALYVLASPSVPEEVRGKAIELAEAGEWVSHARAKALKAGLDTPTIKAGEDYTVADETSPYYGQTVKIQSVERKDGIVTGATADGGVVSLPLSELINPAPEPPKPPKKEQPNHLSAIASELEIERERVQLLEGILQKLCAAARSGKLSDELLSEAESLL